MSGGEVIDQRITNTAAFASGLFVACLFGALSLALFARLLHKLLVQKAPCKLASGLLLGFAAYCSTRCATMISSTVAKEWKDSELILPTVLYVVLVLLMLALWDSFLARVESSRGHHRSLVARVAIPVVGALTGVEAALLCWSLAGTPFPNDGKVIYGIDAVLCFISGGAFAATGFRLRGLSRACGVAVDDVPRGECSASVQGLADDVASTSSDSSGDAVSGTAVGARLRCCLVELLARPLDVRAQMSAILLGSYTLLRGVAPILNACLGASSYQRQQQYVIPAFFFVEWLFLLLSLSLIVGPPSAADTLSQVSIHQRQTARLLGGPAA